MPEENRPPRPAPCSPVAIRALQESHKSITMASITSSAVFGKVSALKASKSVKRCVRCDVIRFCCCVCFRRPATIRDRVSRRIERPMRSYRDRGTPGSRSRVGSSSGRDANDATVWDVTRGVREERKSSLTRIARGTPRGDARRRRSVSTVRGVRIGVRSRSRTDRDDMRLAKPTARDPGRGVFPGSVTRNEWWILFLV